MLTYYYIFILILSLYYYINDIYFMLHVTLIFHYYTIIFIKIGRKCALYLYTHAQIAKPRLFLRLGDVARSTKIS